MFGWVTGVLVGWVLRLPEADQDVSRRRGQTDRGVASGSRPPGKHGRWKWRGPGGRLRHRQPAVESLLYNGTDLGSADTRTLSTKKAASCPEACLAHENLRIC